MLRRRHLGSQARKSLRYMGKVGNQEHSLVWRHKWEVSSLAVVIEDLADFEEGTVCLLSLYPWPVAKGLAPGTGSEICPPSILR